MGMRKKDLRVVGKPSAEGPYVLLDSPIPPNNSNIRLPAATSAALARSQFHLTLIRRNTGIAWMREGSLPGTSQFHLTLIRRNTGIAWMREGSLPGTSKQSTGLFFRTPVLLCAHQTPPGFWMFAQFAGMTKKGGSGMTYYKKKE